MQQNVKWGGGSFSVQFNNNRQSQSNLFATCNPTLNTNLSAAYVQPLLRNFRIDDNRQQLRITRLNQDISEITLRGNDRDDAGERAQCVFRLDLRHRGG